MVGWCLVGQSGTVVILQPSMDHYERYKSMLARQRYGHQDCFSMMDEQSITELYHKELPGTLTHHFSFVDCRLTLTLLNRSSMDICSSTVQFSTMES
jgi:hypothetical protein